MALAAHSLDATLLTQHTAGLFHIRANGTDAFCSLWPQKEIILFAHQVDAVGIFVPRIDTVLSQA